MQVTDTSPLWRFADANTGEEGIIMSCGSAACSLAAPAAAKTKKKKKRKENEQGFPFIQISRANSIFDRIADNTIRRMTLLT